MRTVTVDGKPVTILDVNEAYQAMREVSLKTTPDQAFVAAGGVMALTVCFCEETITEAIDAFRDYVPIIEKRIRDNFPNVADVKESETFKGIKERNLEHVREQLKGD